MLSQHPILWILTSAILSKKINYLTDCRCKLLPNLVCFHNFAFRLLEISIVTKSSRPVPEDTSKVKTLGLVRPRSALTACHSCRQSVETANTALLTARRLRPAGSGRPEPTGRPFISKIFGSGKNNHIHSIPGLYSTVLQVSLCLSLSLSLSLSLLQ